MIDKKTMKNILDKIVGHKKEEVERRKKEKPVDSLKKNLDSSTRDFKSAISASGKMNLIAEIKKASPSAGVIREDFDPVKIAGIYRDSGVSAISVLTDKEFFKGDISYLSSVRESANLPLLRKDFIIDEYQIYESRVSGADAILLIAKILESNELKDFLSIASSLKMDSLVEVHNENELIKALDASSDIIGINNRNLEDFKTDLNNTFSLMDKIPERKTVVSESGIKTKDDINLLKEKGVNAVLIGESFLRSKDISGKIKELGF